MNHRNILFPMASYPEPTSPATIARAVEVAQTLRARIIGLSFEIEPPVSAGYGPYMMPGVGTMIAVEQAKTEAHAREIIHDFAQEAKRRGVTFEVRRLKCSASAAQEIATEMARLFDLTVIGIAEASSIDRAYAEAIIFGSGRPCLALSTMAGATPVTFERPLVAFDYSAPAARALADALPLLQQAARPIVLTVREEDNLAPHAAEDLGLYLAAHGVSPIFEIVEASGRTAAAVIKDRAHAHGADLIIMGAFGHSRVRAFILGGVTQSMLAEPKTTIFFSH